MKNHLLSCLFRLALLLLLSQTEGVAQYPDW